MNQHYCGLYIHVPFCAAKCYYCDFYSIPDHARARLWLSALKKEIVLYRRRFQVFDTVYVGGGTPTSLDISALEEVFAEINRNFTILQEAEITIEANPQDLTPSVARRLRSLGCNRLSIGIQSLDDSVLRFLSRRHIAAQAREAFFIARDAGFDNINLDLIYAVPGQTLSSWLDTLERAVELAPEHFSCYQLTVKDGTTLEELIQRGIIQAVADTEQQMYFAATDSFLASVGYQHYEVSNFARNASFYSRHNQKYWNHIPYLGLGPAAHSFSGKKRWWNVSSVDEYICRLTRGENAVEGKETLSAEQLRLERLLLGFRTQRGLERTFFDTSIKTRTALSRLAAARLIRITHDRIMPTTRGFLVADALPSLFL